MYIRRNPEKLECYQDGMHPMQGTILCMVLRKIVKQTTEPHIQTAFIKSDVNYVRLTHVNYATL